MRPRYSNRFCTIWRRISISFFWILHSLFDLVSKSFYLVPMTSFLKSYGQIRHLGYKKKHLLYDNCRGMRATFFSELNEWNFAPPGMECVKQSRHKKNTGRGRFIYYNIIITTTTTIPSGAHGVFLSLHLIVGAPKSARNDKWIVRAIRSRHRWRRVRGDPAALHPQCPRTVPMKGGN